MTTMRILSEQLKELSEDGSAGGTVRSLSEARTNASEPYATSIRNAWGDLEEWAAELSQKLTRMGDGVRVVGSVGVSKGVGDAVEVVLSFHTLGTLDEEEALDRALDRLSDFTKSTWVPSKRHGKTALVATYDF
jgi:hypothetical protein